MHKAERIRGSFRNVENWHEVGDTGEPAFENSWVNIATWDTTGFYKDPFGVIHLKGGIDSGSAGNTTAFTLPEGYRPSVKKAFNANLITSSPITTTRVIIDTDGTVTPVTGTGSGVSLEQISFRT